MKLLYFYSWAIFYPSIQSSSSSQYNSNMGSLFSIRFFHLTQGLLSLLQPLMFQSWSDRLRMISSSRSKSREYYSGFQNYLLPLITPNNIVIILFSTANKTELKTHIESSEVNRLNQSRIQHSIGSILYARRAIIAFKQFKYHPAMLASKEEKKIDVDERGNPKMTLKTVSYYCQRESLFASPQLNQKLYLQYKGFIKIVPQTLALYHNLIALWLNNNAISKIEGLDPLIHLTSLALNNNSISKMEGLQNLQNLCILNLSNNKIELVEGLQSLRKLQTINLSHNFIINHKSIGGLACCQSLSSLDLSMNQLENTEEVYQEIINNEVLSCLYLKATPLAREFRNYRKRFISALKRLKFLDDRPVLEQDHRLSEAWAEGGLEYQRLQKQKLAQEKQQRQKAEKQARSVLSEQSTKRTKPESFIASVKQTSLRIMNIDDKQEEERIINTYFRAEKEEVERNKQKMKEIEAQQQINSDYYHNHQTEVIAAKVQQIMGNSEVTQTSKENTRIEQQLNEKWKPKYQRILQTLLLRYKFDFSQVQPSFNMLLAEVNKKLMRAPVRFQMDELRKIWTKVEVRRRAEQKA